MRASCGTDLSCSRRILISAEEKKNPQMEYHFTSLENAAIWACCSNSTRWLSNKSGLERSTPRMMQSARLDAVWSPRKSLLGMSVGGLVGWREMEGENVQVLDGECDSFRGECRHCHRLAYTPPSVTWWSSTKGHFDKKKKKRTVQKSDSLTPLTSVLPIENNTFECFTCVGVYVCQAF